MKKILLLIVLSLILVACNSNDQHDERYEKYDMYGVVDYILEEQNTIDVNNTTWASKSGLIPEDQESGTAYNLIYTEKTNFSFEYGERTSLEELHEHQQIGIYLNEDGTAKEIVILDNI